jgi:hypothetical protein
MGWGCSSVIEYLLSTCLSPLRMLAMGYYKTVSPCVHIQEFSKLYAEERSAWVMGHLQVQIFQGPKCSPFSSLWKYTVFCFLPYIHYIQKEIVHSSLNLQIWKSGYNLSFIDCCSRLLLIFRLSCLFLSFVCLFVLVVGSKPRASHMLGKHSSTEPLLSPRLPFCHWLVGGFSVSRFWSFFQLHVCR